MKRFFFLLLITITITSFIKKPQAVFNIRDYGAVGDGKTDDAIAIQKAIDACNAAGGGRVLIPSGGVYLSSPFDLKSFVEFYVETNAKVLANPDENVYT